EQGWIWLNGGETVPAGADSVTIRCSVHGLVDAWFDDIQLSIWESSGTGIETEESNSGSSSTATPALHQNYPNPFQSATTITYELPCATHVSVSIFDTAGRRVCTLVDQARLTGNHSIVWDGRDSSGYPAYSGIYFCRLDAGAESRTKTMLLL
ncbi:MAG: T9SS type A sorting domain-containing protein, partial [Candidatus Sabulitectum sp.]|nr:T9SS type A sorting domain-containing protein [Candidatus Sabulitectum sp.]